MGLNKHYDELKKILDEQISKIVKKGDITPQELDSLYKASAIMLDMETEKAMEEGTGRHSEMDYSQRMARYEHGQSYHYPWFMYYDNEHEPHNSYRRAYNGAYDGAYDASMDSGYSERRGRDQRSGRYISRSSEKEHMIEKLEHMMDEVSSDRERRALQQCIDKLEQS